MFESWIVRLISVLVVMTAVGLGWYQVRFSRLKNRGVEESEARSKASVQAKTSALVVTFLYMVAMVSVAGLFM